MNKDTHIMLDLETFGTVAGVGIMAIGAAMFKFDGTGDIIDNFYVLVNRSSCKAYDLVEDPETIKWWESQEGPAHEEFMRSTRGEGVSLHEALDKFSNWVAHSHGVQVWGNGADFDNSILSTAYYVCGVDRPWGRRASRCYRTIKAINHGVFSRRFGVLHRADDDAVTQAFHLMNIQQRLNLQFEDV